MTPQQIEYERHIALNPEDVLTHGNYKRHKELKRTASWKWMDKFNEQQRLKAAEEAKEEAEKNKHRNEL